MYHLRKIVLLVWCANIILLGFTLGTHGTNSWKLDEQIENIEQEIQFTKEKIHYIEHEVMVICAHNQLFQGGTYGEILERTYRLCI